MQPTLLIVLKLSLRKIITLLLIRELLQTKVQLLKNSGLPILLKKELKRQLQLLRMLLKIHLQILLKIRLQILLEIHLLKIILRIHLLKMLLRIYLLFKMLLEIHLPLQILLKMHLLLKNANLVEMLSLKVSLKMAHYQTLTNCQTLTNQLRKITLLLGTKIIRIILHLL